MAMDLGIDTDALYSIVDNLKGACRILEDVSSSEDVAMALAIVKTATEAELPEWLEATRRSVREFANSLAV